MENLGKVTIGLATGVLFGAAVGLLVTPKSGKENRHVIAARARELGQRARNWKGRNGAEEFANHHAGVSS
jgi:gas vesicle protein